MRRRRHQGLRHSIGGRSRCNPLRVRSPPGGAWMLGKPIPLPEARDLQQDGADWLGGRAAASNMPNGAGSSTLLRVVPTAPPPMRPLTTIPRPNSTNSRSRRISAAGRRWSATCHRGLREFQDHQVGVAGWVRLVLLAAQLGVLGRGRLPGGASASDRDRQAQRRGSRRGHQQHPQAAVRPVGLNITDW